MSDHTPAITAALEHDQDGMPSEAWLVVVAGPDLGKQLRLRHGSYRVGKSEDCDLVLGDASVSRYHLELELGPGGCVLRDLSSKNGSFFRGARFSELTVGLGALVQIGESELQLLGSDGTPAMAPASVDHFGRLYGRSLAMRRVFALLERIAATEQTILIEGETGTGKELCAEAIQAASPRHKGPFVVCDLAGISNSLIESELFGHTRGAFTGADRERAGAFARAHGGTIFIDEVGELDLEMQPRLLRALEHRMVKPVGGNVYADVDVRVIAATNRDLAAECRAGRFREDLYHRLAVLRVRLPPLRERKEDIEALVALLVAGRDVHLSAETRALLTDYDWPGNVRELRNVIERGLSLVKPGEALTPGLLGLTLPARSLLPQPLPEAELAADFRTAKEQLIATWERAYLSELIRRAGGNISRAARQGGFDRRYLYRLLKKHDIKVPDE